ncbi:hypothetical protein FQA47_014402 [Oryzias melastigma]|uniref:Uncharacterized protein n=1 Tax=Oryzias melastigma TaxID=30732 RepID=A0A834CFE1_ORYME|nr:hypothetical protein FQA47_014402 [Oryzias melastigma]
MSVEHLLLSAKQNHFSSVYSRLMVGKIKSAAHNLDTYKAAVHKHPGFWRNKCAAEGQEAVSERDCSFRGDNRHLCVSRTHCFQAKLHVNDRRANTGMTAHRNKETCIP